MRIKATVTINLGTYMDIRPEIELDVPDGLTGKELVRHLHEEYWGLFDDREQIRKHTALVNKVAENARHGIATPVGEFIEATENDPEAAHLVNENKKAFNRDEYARKHPKQSTPVEAVPIIEI